MSASARPALTLSSPVHLHEAYDPSTITTIPPSSQRQQPRTRRPPPSSNLPAHASISVGVDPATISNPYNRSRHPGLQHETHREASEPHPTAQDRPISPYRSSLQQTGESFWPPRTTRISKNTISAIHWVLEEAIRKPFPFTPVTSELNASMTDAMGGVGVAVPPGHGRAHNGVGRTAHHGPQGAPARGIITPSDIMRRRDAREARLKAEQEAKEREQREAAELRRKQQELEQQQKARYAQQERAMHAAGVAGDSQATQRPGVTTSSRPPEMPLPQDPQDTRFASAPTTRAPQAQHERRATQDQPIPRTVQQSSQARPQDQGARAQASQPATGTQAQNRARPSFPHAFERWETLSSHWEGLTGYWIRRLEQNNEELSKDPLGPQMSRQITDLSAAGANLFHAVVELQRLRASSERKFQRWFFDTRAEQERSQEVRAELERLLSAERQGHSETLAAMKQAQSDKVKAEELVKEMRRELQISREEARRAWEELGRREQEERERTASLRSGEPTIVGGVQVVPMVQTYPSRHASTNRPPTREGPYAGGPGATTMGGQTHQEPQPQKEKFSFESSGSTPTAAEQEQYGGTPRHPPTVTVSYFTSEIDHCMPRLAWLARLGLVLLLSSSSITSLRRVGCRWRGVTDSHVCPDPQPDPL